MPVTIFLHFIDVIALFYLVMILWIPFFWLVFHPAIRHWRRFGNRSFWVALPIWLGFGVGLILTRHWIFARRLERNALTWSVGGGLFFAASWLEGQTRRTLGLRRLVGLPELYPEHPSRGIARTGVYARIRHPRYLFYMLALFSLALLTGATAIFLLAILNILMYQVLAPLEERELLNQYGLPYEVYRQSVPRFVPRTGRKSETSISS
jgi:protein-S-isoprenylcysteine O-methyltransferase Ste14